MTPPLTREQMVKMYVQAVRRALARVVADGGDERFISDGYEAHDAIVDAVCDELLAAQDETLETLRRRNAELDGALERLRAAALTALTRVTEGMDRAGGDGYGMPECPWCKCQFEGEIQHLPDCELALARQVIADIEAGIGTTPRRGEQ